MSPADDPAWRRRLAWRAAVAVGVGRGRGRRRGGVGPAAARVKPAPFDYVAPHTIAAALGALGEDAKPLAGGQSLVPLLNFRLARPATLVDLNGIAELAVPAPLGAARCGSAR